jgi:tRNA threonylcarbamoyladenosine biosynthesis protein TsaE
VKNKPSAQANPQPRTPNTWLGEFTTHSPQETFALAKRIGEQLGGSEVFLLTGDLGAGKTVFAKGLAAGLGIDPADVTSPSFTLVNLHKGRLMFYHVDLYRLESGRREDLGLDEVFDEQKAVTAIEWAERLAYAPSNSISVNIEYLSDRQRMIDVRRSV